MQCLTFIMGKTNPNSFLVPLKFLILDVEISTHFPTAKIFMACFAVDVLHDQVIPELKTQSNAPIIVIATKTDLRTSIS